jgi:hypothetical protein
MSVSKLVQLCSVNTFFHNVLHLSWLLGAIVIFAEVPQKSRTSQTSMSQLLLFPNDSNSVYFIDETAHLYENKLTEGSSKKVKVTFFSTKIL